MSTRIFLGIKAAPVAFTLFPSVMKSGSLNLLEPSRPRRPVTGVPYLILIKDIALNKDGVVYYGAC